MNNELITNSELAILGLIAEQPKHGYQIEQEIRARGMREWTDIAFSSIYHFLTKLESRGWLESSKQDSVDRPARKNYLLSEDGRRIYTQAVLIRLREPRPNSGDFILAVANLGCLSREEIISALQHNRAALVTSITQIQKKHADDFHAKPDLPWFVDALFAYSEMRIRAEIHIIDHLLDQTKHAFSSGGPHGKTT